MKPFPKRLIEVDLPIKRISEHARREKSIRHGHISTLHIWWARRPLAACRAVICASLWPDPADPLCPQSFRDEASRLVNEFARKAVSDRELAGHCSHESWNKWQKLANTGGLNPGNEAHWNVLRFALLDFIADFANWDSSMVREYLDTSRALTQAAHEALGGAVGTKPLVVDPFAGGGSIPLEALRVGADAFASDLNPVAVLLNKVVLEYIPKYGQHLADEVRKWGVKIQEQAETELADFYPEDPDGAMPIAYLWARTIRCEGPGCGADVPLVTDLWLSERADCRSILVVEPDKQRKTIKLSVNHHATTKDAGTGVMRRSSVTCPVCGFTTAADRVRGQFKGRAGGANDARLLAVVTNKPSEKGKTYRAPSKEDFEALRQANQAIDTYRLEQREPTIPDEDLPYLRSIFNINLLDVNAWNELFSNRQLLSLLTLARLVRRAGNDRSDSRGVAMAIRACLACALDRQADYNSSLCRWIARGEFIGNTFGRQALGIIWDFAEVNPLSRSTGSWASAVEWVARVIETNAASFDRQATVQEASATESPLPDDGANLLCTDPPYYDLVPYADLSDFYYVWLKRSVGPDYPQLFSGRKTPKEQEIVQLAERNKDYSYKTRERFEDLMSQAMREARRVVGAGGLGVVFFAHKGTSAWESQLQAIIKAGWIVTASWPIDTERGARLRAMNSATLASSVQLVCRPREKTVGSVEDIIGDWRDVLGELPKRISEWMPRLAAEKVVGADAIFACLGPALEIYSRYSSVEKASGELVTLKEYLEYVWAAVAKEALNMIFEGADATGFEEDARLTAMWLWTLSTGTNGDGPTESEEQVEDDEENSTGKAKMTGFVLEYDAARKIAQGLGAHLEQLSSLVEVSGDKARLLPVSERAHHLFGKNEGAAPTKRKGKPKQLSLLDVIGDAEESEGSWGEKNASRLGNTVLDRIHQSMILFAAGRGEAVKRFLVSDGVGQDQRFWRLAQALSALYPKGTDERRWVEGVLARKKGLGF